jgi:hypothetical protein
VALLVAALLLGGGRREPLGERPRLGWIYVRRGGRV